MLYFDPWGHHTNIHTYYSSQHFRKRDISHFMNICCGLLNVVVFLEVSLHFPKCCVLLYVVVFWPFGATIQIYIHTYNSNQHFRSWRWSFVVFVKCCVSWIVFAFSRMLCFLKCCCVSTLGGHHTSTVINSTCVFRKRRCCNKLILRN